jgi:hypothetical protein
VVNIKKKMADSRTYYSPTIEFDDILRQNLNEKFLTIGEKSRFARGLSESTLGKS